VRSGLAASGRPGRRGPAGEAEVAALAAFPLLVAGELRGVLAGFFRRPLEEGTADLLATFAALVTPALVAATERRFHDLVEGLDAIVWEADAATFRFTFVSRQAEAILGYPVAQWLTEPDFWVKHLHPDDRARAVAFCLEATEAGRNHELEYRAIAADGRVVWLRDIVRIVSGPDGRPRQLRGVMIDITEQRRAEAALREREEHLRLVVRATDDAVWVWDLRTDEVTWNEALERLFGYPPAEVLPRVEWWYERIHPDDRERVLSGIHDLLEQGGDSWAAEHRFRRADGGYATVIDRGYVVRDQDGRPLRMIGAMVDITRRVQLEEQLRQSQKMEAIGRLAGGIAHDFNNILTAITGYSELLLGRLEEGDPLRRHALEIHRAAERAASLTRQLLAFSRRQVLRPTVVDLNAVVSNMDGMLRRLIGEDIELRTLPAADLGWVRADTGQLEQAILNLAVNARDAMPQGGKLTIETANVELDEAYAQRHAPVVPGRYVLLAVSDTGCGMDPETRARIFEPFFTTKERGKGTGLGLATVYGIVKQSGGYIWVYSEPGHGSTFKIYLPRVEAAPAPLPPPPARPPAPGRETVLLVEDEDAVRTLARQVLEQHGYRVLEAAGAADALALVEWHRGSIDLLLTDVVMPGMSGRELAERFAAARGAVKVLYMSGYTDSAIVHHGILDPGTAFLQKPFSPAALAGKVRDVLDAP
ncbi:MAG TPA: PAS domain-containing protein, partial [Thermodesulfobacteriota bacterium]|nr:PAS domain-containing protein [Thermodesulfobacteriota bacterium]